MTTFDINSLFQEAAKEDLSSIGQDYNDWKPVEGEEYTVVPTHLRFRTTKSAGMPAWGVRLQVTGGEDDGKSFWQNFNTVKDYPSINAETFHALGVLGFTQEILAATPEMESAATDTLASLHGKPAKMTAKYRKNKKGGGDPFPNHHYEAIVTGVVVPEEDDDEDDSWLDV